MHDAAWLIVSCLYPLEHRMWWRGLWWGRGFFYCKWSESQAARYHQAQMSTSFQRRVWRPTCAAWWLHSNVTNGQLNDTNIRIEYFRLYTDVNTNKWYVVHICKVTFYLPHEICVTAFPMSSNTFLGLISWFVELCPSCPYPPAPNVNTPPSCKMQHQCHQLYWCFLWKQVLQGQNFRVTPQQTELCASGALTGSFIYPLIMEIFKEHNLIN